MMNKELHDAPPAIILKAYGLPVDTTHSETLSGGLVNTTYLVWDGISRHILQRLHPDLSIELTSDAAAVSSHLRGLGWESPEIFLTSEGQPHAFDEQYRAWRLLPYLESDKTLPDPTPTVLAEAASLLGRWHRDVESLEYIPRNSIPHFHDIQFYAEQLESSVNKLPDASCRSIARQVLLLYEQLPELPVAPNRLIHGDPKLANMLFRDGKPFTLIDFDTLMDGSAWFDIGDMMRSGLQQANRRGHPLSEQSIRGVTEAYRVVAQPETSSDEFFANAMNATSHISIELAMRYLQDVSDETYFSWDHKTFNSRRDNHMYKVRSLLASYFSLPMTSFDIAS